jgi:hypothetical protein
MSWRGDRDRNPAQLQRRQTKAMSGPVSADCTAGGSDHIASCVSSGAVLAIKATITLQPNENKNKESVH